MSSSPPDRWVDRLYWGGLWLLGWLGIGVEQAVAHTDVVEGFMNGLLIGSFIAPWCLPCSPRWPGRRGGAELGGWQRGLLLAICGWAACRFYYFLFHVLHVQVDPTLPSAGVLDLVQHLLTRCRNRKP